MLLQAHVASDQFPERLVQYAEEKYARGPFHNPFVHMSNGGAFQQGLSDWSCGVRLSDGTSLSASFDPKTGAMSNFTSTWPVVEPKIDEKYRRLVDSARQDLRAEGAPSELTLRFVNTFTVDKKQVLDLRFVDVDAFPYRATYQIDKGTRIFSPTELALRRSRDLLAKLGSKRYWHAMNDDAAGWNEFNGTIDLVNDKKVGYELSFDSSTGQLTWMNRQPQDNGRHWQEYRASPEEISAVKAKYEVLGLGQGDLDPKASKAEQDLEFDMSFPPKKHPFEVQVRTALFLDPNDLSVVGYYGRSRKQIQEAHTIPPIDPKYLAVADAARGKLYGDPLNKRFACADVLIGNADWGNRTLVPAYGWISSDLKTITGLDGVDYPVTKFEAYKDIEKSLTGQSKAAPFLFASNLQWPTLCTPALLERVGKKDLAKRLYHFLDSNIGKAPQYSLYNCLRNRYRLLLADAFMRGSDPEALGWADHLCQVDEQIVKVDDAPGNRKSDIQQELREENSVRADIERRLSQIAKITPGQLVGETRAENLIGALDGINDRQGGQPGGVSFNLDPLVKELVSVGPEAVPALIKAIGTDERFTRSITFPRNFMPNRDFHPVREIEWIVLGAIWPSAPTIDLNKPEKASAALQKEWQAVGSLTEPERMLRELEVTDRDHWLGAAGFLASRKIDASFRAQHGSEISRLMAKDAEVFASANNRSLADLHEVGHGLEIAHDLARWDSAASLITLQLTCKRALEKANEWKEYNTYVTQDLSEQFGIAIQDRMGLKDPTATDDFSAMLAHYDISQSFQPEFWKTVTLAPADSPIAMSGRKFISSLEPMLLSENGRNKVQTFVGRAVWSPLLATPEVRKLIVAMMTNETPEGEAYIDDSGKLIRQNRQSRQIGIAPKTGSFKLPPNTRLPFSIGDQYCEEICSQIVGAPHFEIWSSAVSRKAAKAQVVAFLSDESKDWMAVLKKSPFYHDWEWSEKRPDWRLFKESP